MARCRIWMMVLLASAAVAAVAQDEVETPFEASLQAVQVRAAERSGAVEKLEEEYLALLTPEASPEERGQVCLCMVELLDGARRPDAVEVYCREALRYPLAPDEAAKMYCRWADASTTRFRDWRGERWRVARHIIGEPLLAGLRLVLDHGAPMDLLPSVAVDKLSGPSLPPEALAAHQKQMEERRRVDTLNALCLSRKGMSDLLVYIYSLPPADPGEMKELLGKTLGDYPDAVAGLTAALDARLKRGQAAN